MKKLLLFVAALTFGLTASTGTSYAAPKLVWNGPEVGGCNTSVSAEVVRPVSTAAPLQMAIGVRAGSAADPCTIVHDEIQVSAQLWFLPVLGPDTLVSTLGAHDACGTGSCTYSAAFASGTMPPGIYYVKGFVRFKSGSNFSASTTFSGDNFLYTGLEVTDSPI